MPSADLPPFIVDAGPASVVSYRTLADTRPQLLARIGDILGFDVEGGRARLRKEELAQIAVFALAVEAGV